MLEGIIHEGTAMERKPLLTSEQKDIALYIGKCVTGFAALSLFGLAFNIPDMSWVAISMLLVLTPDNREAVPLTVVRIKSNIVAAVSTLLFLLVTPNTTLAICLSITATILICYWLKLMAGSRAALAAVVIVALHPMGEHLWSTSAERVLAVITGCILGLVLTFAFHRQLPRRSDITGGNQSE